MIVPEDARVGDCSQIFSHLCSFRERDDLKQDLLRICHDRVVTRKDPSLFGLVVRHSIDRFRWMKDLVIIVEWFSTSTACHIGRSEAVLIDLTEQSLTDEEQQWVFHDRQKFFAAQDATFMLMFPQMYSQK